ncbi:hypothetical protein [Marinitoga sp. 38H-ov]|uniref:hypothetical protein n=1 Tax=Marinitoga sp. 38H-ov TaxID=1755814 RepID=UPI0013ED17F2|nr:hypothetical protein [Marinitoga sp. 38H-ov]KAF2956561.1 hypothetical protein AS160_05025 [Marinitoga sp. 38H-ov]
MKKIIILFFFIINIQIFSYQIIDNFDFYMYLNNPKELFNELYSNIPFFRYLYSKEGAGQELLYNYLIKNLTDEELKDTINFISSDFLFVSNDNFDIRDIFWVNPIQDIINFISNFNGIIITDYNNQEKLINLIKKLFSYDVEYIQGEYFIKYLNLKLYPIGGHILLYNNEISLEKIFRLLDDFNTLKLEIKDNIFISFKNNKFDYLIEPFQKKYINKYSDNINGFLKINYINKEIVIDVESSLKLINLTKFDPDYKLFGDSILFLDLSSSIEMENIISKIFLPNDNYAKESLKFILSTISSENNIYITEYFSRKDLRLSIIIPGNVDIGKLENKLKTWGINKNSLGRYYYYSIYYEDIGNPVYLYFNDNQMIFSSISPSLMKYLIVNTKKFSNLKIYNSNNIPENIIYIWYSNINSFFEENIGNSVPGEFLIINASDNNKFIEKIILR